MKEKHDLLEAPSSYHLCLKRECPKASTCLRQLVEQEISDSVEYWTIISPKYQATQKGDCPHYRSNVKVTYAKGFVGMLENMPNKQMRSVIPHLIGYFGQRTYYRVRKGERLLSPSEQKGLQNILKRCGVTEPPKYDAYVEDYAW